MTGVQTCALPISREFMAGLEKIVLPKKWRTARPEIKVRELLYRIKRRVPKAKLATVSALLARVPEFDVHPKKRARRVTNRLQRAASDIGRASCRGRA